MNASGRSPSVTVVALLCCCTAAWAGPCSQPAGQPGSAIPANDPAIQEWASGITLSRGPQIIADPGAGLASFGAPEVLVLTWTPSPPCTSCPSRRSASCWAWDSP